MGLLEKLGDRETWERFYEYKNALACPKEFTAELREFIDREAYLPVLESIRRAEPFPLPRKAVISKMGSRKKRTVYIYPEPENTVLKLLTYLLLRRYDGLFSNSLYSFRPGRSAKDAIRRLKRVPGLFDKYAYKVDISNYFNSIDLSLFLPVLKSAVEDDPELFAFLSRLLSEPQVRERGRVIAEEKGIMAGTPLASFYANLFLKDLDRLFAERGIPYARYSDDIILFGESPETVRQYAAEVREYLASRLLSVNPDKEEFFTPETGFSFLGFYCRKHSVDIAPATVRKLKAKMRRKTRALMRWKTRNALSGEKAAKAFIRIFNRKLFETSEDNELTWSFWFFSVITETTSLSVIDRYAQDCVRFLLTGKHTKARYNARYEDLKALGYRSLVHAYYEFGEKRNSVTDLTNAVEASSEIL